MVRLVPEIIENAPQFTNANKDREIDLRGHKASLIENMGCTLDQFDTIDLSENELRKLDGFPLLKRAKNLILTNNKLLRIAEDFGQQLPNLSTLILTGNAFTELRDLEPLASCEKLTFISLLHCAVTMRPNYRLYVISRVPTLRFLDYRRVTESERKLAKAMFRRLTPAVVTELTPKTSQQPSSQSKTSNGGTGTFKTFTPGEPIDSAGKTATSEDNGAVDAGDDTAAVKEAKAAAANAASTNKRRHVGASQQDLYAIQDAIKRARTMDEVDRLHHLLNSGQFTGFAQQRLKQQQQSSEGSVEQPSGDSVQQQSMDQDDLNQTDEASLSNEQDSIDPSATTAPTNEMSVVE